MMDRETIVRLVRESDAFQGEARYLERGGYQLTEQPRLFKHLEDDLVRVVFATNVTEVVEGTVVAMVTLYDQRQKYNIYAHTICAGPGVNILLKARFNPMPQARPQPGVAGEAAIAQFVAWKEASWTKFLNDELLLGTETASSLWIATFWKALDRMFGGGHLVNYDPDAILAAHI
ncbi:MAG TPA: hypothetical protein PKA50_08100 [Gemmatimonadales bacterium]|nr:hypothetical protein [Gemmatimonadales bacterium]